MPLRAFLLASVALLGSAAAFGQPDVGVYGAMRNIMQDGNLSAAVNLDTLDRIHLYALGPVEGLQGEIAVLDGRVYRSRRSGDHVETDSLPPAAAMLVYSRVRRWVEVPLPDTDGMAAIEQVVAAAAARHGLDPEKPFVFRIEGRLSGSSHVIHWEKDSVHTMDNHRQFALSGPLEIPGIIGFYSRKHAGVFTHHPSKVHMHAVHPMTGYVGHVDALQIADARLFLPVE